MNTLTPVWQEKIQNLQSTLEKSEIADRFESSDVSGIDMKFLDESSTARNGSDTNVGTPSSLESIPSSAEKILNIINYRDYEDGDRPECHSCKLVQNNGRNTKDAATSNFNGETFRTNGSNLNRKKAIDWATMIESLKDEMAHHMQKYLSKQQMEKQKTEGRRKCVQNLQCELEGNSQRVFFLLKELEDLM